MFCNDPIIYSISPQNTALQVDSDSPIQITFSTTGINIPDNFNIYVSFEYFRDFWIEYRCRRNINFIVDNTSNGTVLTIFLTEMSILKNTQQTSVNKDMVLLKTLDGGKHYIKIPANIFNNQNSIFNTEIIFTFNVYDYLDERNNLQSIVGGTGATKPDECCTDPNYTSIRYIGRTGGTGSAGWPVGNPGLPGYYSGGTGGTGATGDDPNAEIVINKDEFKISNINVMQDSGIYIDPPTRFEFNRLPDVKNKFVKLKIKTSNYAVLRYSDIYCDLEVEADWYNKNLEIANGQIKVIGGSHPHYFNSLINSDTSLDTFLQTYFKDCELELDLRQFAPNASNLEDTPVITLQYNNSREPSVYYDTFYITNTNLPINEYSLTEFKTKVQEMGDIATIAYNIPLNPEPKNPSNADPDEILPVYGSISIQYVNGLTKQIKTIFADNIQTQIDNNVVSILSLNFSTDSDDTELNDKLENIHTFKDFFNLDIFEVNQKYIEFNIYFWLYGVYPASGEYVYYDVGLDSCSNYDSDMAHSWHILYSAIYPDDNVKNNEISDIECMFYVFATEHDYNGTNYNPNSPNSAETYDNSAYKYTPYLQHLNKVCKPLSTPTVNIIPTTGDTGSTDGSGSDVPANQISFDVNSSSALSITNKRLIIDLAATPLKPNTKYVLHVEDGAILSMSDDVIKVADIHFTTGSR